MASCRIKTLPSEERPRERLLRDGVNALSLSELLAIVLSSGTVGKSVLNLAQELLAKWGGLERLLEASVVELMQVKGIGKAKAIQLKAVFGIVLKCRKSSLSPNDPILTSEDAYRLARGEIGHSPQEILLVILRDIRGRMIHMEQVSIGTLSQVLVHPREIFYPAVRYKAHSLILAHNHPSGDPTPSKADLELTRALVCSSQVMGIPLDDHLIVCPNAYTSLRERGYLGKREKF